jgi:thiol-disulfide isomerase/thioredoxin
VAKRWFAAGLMLLVFLPVTGCGVPQEKYDAVVAERDAAQVEVASFQSQLTGAQSDLATAQSDLATAQSYLTTGESDLSETESDLSETESDLADAQAQISSLQSQISSLRSDLAEAEAQVAELEEVITAQEGSQVGNLSPDFQLRDLDGETVSLTELRGSPVMLNFWATWCPPCRREMPYLQQIYEEWQDKGLILLTIDLRESTSTVREFIQSNNLSLPALLDTNGNVASKYNITAVPTTFFINKYGLIQARRVGSFSSVQEIENYLNKIMP